MRKAEVLKHYKTQTAVAVALGITVQAVNSWPDPIPPMAAWELAKKNPTLAFDRKVYRNSSRRTRRIVDALSA